MADRLPETIRAIAFPTAGYLFALPMQAILKVIRTVPGTQQSFDDVGLLSLGSEAIALLDLEARLGLATGAAPARKPFAMLARAPGGNLYAIQIEDLPNMLDLPAANIQPLPETARRSPLRRVARYAALWQTPDQETLIFLLDLQLATQALSRRT